MPNRSWPADPALGMGRVLQISKYYPPVMGGIETVAGELVEGLGSLGFHADVLCSSSLARSSVDLLPSGSTVTRAASWGRLLSTSIAPGMVLALRRVCEQYDVIHVHMPDPMAAAAIWFARPRSQLVVHWHSDVIRQRRAMVLYRPLQDWLLQRADAIIATSGPYADSSEALRRWRSKVVIIPIGISDHSLDVLPEEVERIRGRYGGRKIVFALGRMAYYKGFEFLVEAAPRLPADCIVVIGGEGETRSVLTEQVRRMGLQSKVHLPGALPDAILPSYYAACDVFCMPSLVRAEAYGVATVEAMCLGKPVVSTHIPGSGVSWVNIDGITGLCAAPGDVAGLSQALCRVLGDETLRLRLGAAARARYEAELTASAMSRRTVALYRSMGQGAAPLHSNSRQDGLESTRFSDTP